MDDLISRQRILRIITGAYVKSKDIDSFYALLQTAFENILPSAQPEQECEKCIFKPFKQFQPERKNGEWIDIWDKETDSSDSAICSVCEMHSVRPLGRFCKWCGSDNRGEQNGND